MHKIYQVDAFTSDIFSGNPAAVCPLSEWLDDGLMQQIATENNLSETAFFVQEGDQFAIRWFTPTVEVDLCGHATLAAAFVLFNEEGFEKNTIPFYSPRSGNLPVSRNANRLALNFPTDSLHDFALSDEILACFNIAPKQAFKGRSDVMLVFEAESDIIALSPNFTLLANLPFRGVIATAKSDMVDFVSRFFAPQSGINEDPVTGSAHTTLAPYWAKQLGKSELSAVQLSARKGFLRCKLLGERVEISGGARLYLKGEIFLK